MRFRFPGLFGTAEIDTGPEITWTRDDPALRGLGPVTALAVYNAERARGLVHTPEWDAKMAGLQAEYDCQANTKGGTA